MEDFVETVVGIPGPWKSKKELATAIASRSNGYILVGDVLVDVESKEAYNIELYDYDEELWKSFNRAGNFSDEQMQEIHKHNTTLYLIKESGDMKSIRAMTNAVCGIINAGGIAVKIESSGIAHTADRWVELVHSEDAEKWVHTLVRILSDGDSFYSCGMHNLGYKDVIISADSTPEEAGDLITSFLVFILNESPVVNVGETFRENPHSTVYRLAHEECRMYPSDDLFYNPFGYWRLIPVE